MSTLYGVQVSTWDATATVSPLRRAGTPLQAGAGAFTAGSVRYDKHGTRD